MTAIGCSQRRRLPVELRGAECATRKRRPARRLAGHSRFTCCTIDRSNAQRHCKTRPRRRHCDANRPRPWTGGQGSLLNHGLHRGHRDTRGHLSSRRTHLRAYCDDLGRTVAPAHPGAIRPTIRWSDRAGHRPASWGVLYSGQVFSHGRKPHAALERFLCGPLQPAQPQCLGSTCS